MHISNSFVVVCNIQIVIRMLYHSFEMLLLLSFFYLMVKPGKSFVKIRSRFQIALFFLFIEISNPLYLFDFKCPPPLPRLLGSPVYLGQLPIKTG